MSEPAYLAVMAASAAEPLPAFGVPAGLIPLHDSPALRLFVAPALPHQKSQGTTILGQWHARRPTALAAPLTSGAGRAIAARNARALMSDIWGDYVALIPTAKGESGPACQILRAPFGRLGCYWHTHNGIIAVASHPALLVDAGLYTPRIDRDGLARHIAQPEIARASTCFVGLHALAGGTRLSVSASGPQVDTLWTPWTFCSDAPGIDDVDAAGAALRTVLVASLGAQTSQTARSLLLLSGGVDSSLLAAGLNAIGHPFDALNLVTEAPTGDERSFARLAAAATGARLVERYRSIAGVDPAVSRAAGAARPYARAFTQETERLAGLAADACGAAAVLDGGGGDNLFFNTMTLAAIAEVLSAHGPGARFWRTSATLADLTGSSCATVAARGAIRMITRDNRLRIQPHMDFLSQTARATVAASALHDWYLPPPEIGAGKAAHAALLAPAQATAEQGRTFVANRPWVSPFICQPVVETVLGLPIWSWFAPGRNRAAARAAFSADLPPALIERRTKGTPNAFVHRLFEAHRAWLRPFLLDGHLAALDLVDRDGLARALDDPVPSRDFRFARIMDLADAESWVRSWD